MFRSAQAVLCLIARHRLMASVLFLLILAWSGPGSAQVVSTTFEDGSLDGWSSRAGAALANTTADAHGGTHSLSATNRVAAYDGPQINVSNKIYDGSQYSITVWVKLAPTATQGDTLRLSLQTTLVGHEMHNHIDNPSPLAVFVAIDAIATLFPHIHQQVTELDVSVYAAGDNTSNYGANGGSVPASLIADQGRLYAKYFEAFRALKGKLDAVTFWGFGDDNTWLDSFPINRLDLPLPFDTRLQAKPAYWGIVDPTRLP